MNDKLENECPCKEPGWCEKYTRYIIGKLFDICRGYDDDGNEVLNYETRQKYKQIWEERAQPGLTKEHDLRERDEMARRNQEQIEAEIKKQQPNLLELGLHFATAIFKHVKNNAKRTDPEIMEERLRKCSTCDFLVKNRCLHKKCGCSIAKKAAWASEKCPIGKWRR